MFGGSCIVPGPMGRTMKRKSCLTTSARDCLAQNPRRPATLSPAPPGEERGWVGDLSSVQTPSRCPGDYRTEHWCGDSLKETGPPGRLSWVQELRAMQVGIWSCSCGEAWGG